jgi:hypothetical protein
VNLSSQLCAAAAMTSWSWRSVSEIGMRQPITTDYSSFQIDAGGNSGEGRRARQKNAPAIGPGQESVTMNRPIGTPAVCRCHHPRSRLTGFTVSARPTLQSPHGKLSVAGWRWHSPKTNFTADRRRSPCPVDRRQRPSFFGSAVGAVIPESRLVNCNAEIRCSGS